MNSSILSGIVIRPLVPERWILFGYIHQVRQPPGANAGALLDCLRRGVEMSRAGSAQDAEAVVPVWPDVGTAGAIGARRRDLALLHRRKLGRAVSELSSLA